MSTVDLPLPTARAEAPPAVPDAAIGAIQQETLYAWETILAGKPETVLSGDKTMEMLDFPPKRPGSEIPVVLVPGFTQTAFSFAPVIHQMNDSGRRVLAVGEHHGIDAEARRAHPHPQLRKAMALIAMLDAKGVTRVDLVAHSEGAVVAALAAKLSPGRIRSVVMFNPAGLMREENLLFTAARLLVDQVHGIKDKLFGSSYVRAGAERSRVEEICGQQMARYVKDSPFHTLREALSLASDNVRIDGILKRLQAEGVQVHAILTLHDRLFPLALRDKSRLVREGVFKADHLETMPGGHNTHMEDYVAISRALSRRLLSVEEQDAKGGQ